jgi:ceramide glucosyltransferase
MSLAFAFLTGISVLLAVWQWICGLRFPIQARATWPGPFLPVTLLKPLRGWDEQTAASLRSWLEQDYPERVQVLFGVDDDDHAALEGVRQLIAHLPEEQARLVLCHRNIGPHPKVAKLVQLHPHALHNILVVSDADVWAPPDLLTQTTPLLQDPAVGLINCFYCQPEALTPAMHWIRVTINSDFWTQVLQSNCIHPQDFALGAVMIVRRSELEAIGGFNSFIEYLADDYQLGHRIVKLGRRIELATVVVECRSQPMNWAQVWAHQLRQARTIRACQPTAYFFSILNNVTLWSALWLFTSLTPFALAGTSLALLVRVASALHAESRLCQSRARLGHFYMVPIRDLLHFLTWAGAFLGRNVLWRGNRFIVLPGGKLKPQQGRRHRADRASGIGGSGIDN